MQELFLFGSRSEFDDLCHQIVTGFQNQGEPINRIMFTCRSEYAVKKAEKETLEKSWSKLLKTDVKLKDYDGVVMSDRVESAGRASYVERNQEMINVSDFCVFYYNPQYHPSKRKHSNHDICEYQPKSGTMLAYEYAYTRKRTGHPIEIINVWMMFDETK